MLYFVVVVQIAFFLTFCEFDLDPSVICLKFDRFESVKVFMLLVSFSCDV